MPTLEGVTVVALEQAVAAPFASRQLADLGARVIKVERPGSGDFARSYDESVRGMASHFVWLNRSKESVALDLKTSQGREAIHALVDRADVFLQNLAPGAADRLGLSAAELRARNPRLVHASISGYGTAGPYANKKAYDLLVQCEAGLVSVTGTPETPVKVGISVADIAAGMYAYTGVLTALLRRERTGQGATVEVSMLEALAEWMGFPLAYSMEGPPPARHGSSHAAIAPYGAFRCADGGRVFLGVQNEREWARMCSDVLRAPQLKEDPRFRTGSRRVTHREELTTVIEEALAGLSVDEAEAQLEAAGIACARLRDMREVADHPQLRARDRWRRVDSPVGALDALVPPATLDGEEPVMGPIPELGEHTRQVLADLGLERFPQETP